MLFKFGFLASWVLRALFINMAWLLRSQTRPPYDLLPSWVITGSHRDSGFNLSSPPSASAEQTHCQIILCSLSAVAGNSLFCAVGCKLWEKKSKKKINATKHFSDWWMQAPGFNLFMFQIISPTGHYSPYQPLFPGDGGKQHGNKCRGPILILFYCLAFSWWSTPSP